MISFKKMSEIKKRKRKQGIRKNLKKLKKNNHELIGYCTGCEKTFDKFHKDLKCKCGELVVAIEKKDYEEIMEEIKTGKGVLTDEIKRYIRVD